MKLYPRGPRMFALVAFIVGFSLCLKTTAVVAQEEIVAEGTAITVNALRVAQRAQRNHEERLLRLPGVVAVGVGLTEGGDTLALHVYLNVDEPSASRAAIPREADNVPVRIIESTEIVAFDGPPGTNHKQQFNFPVPMGVSTSSDNGCFAGTLGVRVTRKGSTSQVGYLTNNHVAAAGGPNLCPNSAAFSEDQFQRGHFDNGCSLAGLQKIGDLVQFIPIVFGGAFENTVDVAFVASARNLVSKNVLDIGNPSPSTLEPTLNMPVQKSGRTTGQTFGTITTINATVNVGYGSGCGTAKFVDQMLITPGSFSAGGDSGSLILHRTLKDASNRFRPVGLLFAGSSTITVANRINDVLGAVSAVIDTLAP